MHKNILEKYIPASLTKLEKAAAANPGSTPWIYGAQARLNTTSSTYVCLDAANVRAMSVILNR